jgi:hypothetical protein
VGVSFSCRRTTGSWSRLFGNQKCRFSLSTELQLLICRNRKISMIWSLLVSPKTLDPKWTLSF